ncbi:MAG TPA: hypothetical protein VLA35_07570 [Thermoleophilia bacterium]|nr:hypothetical protein [Thermoleophilia bacterium]
MREQDFRIELFVFPDGTEIEMLVFEQLSEGRQPRIERAAAPHRAPVPPRTAQATKPRPAADEPVTPTTREPHVCPLCRSELVYPVDWQRTSDTAWQLRLRCPECETERDATLGRPEVEDYNRRLYYGSQELAQAAQEISRRNFEEEAAKLVAALELDLILPMDF